MKQTSLLTLLACISFLCSPLFASAKDVPDIIAENTLNETIVLAELEVDGVKIPSFNIPPGFFGYLKLEGRADHLKGQKVFAVIKTFDGISLPQRYSLETNLPAVDESVIIISTENFDPNKRRLADSGRQLSKSEQCFRAWMLARNIYADEIAKGIRKAKLIDLLSPSNFTPVFRAMENRLEDLDIETLDEDAKVVIAGLTAEIHAVIKHLGGRDIVKTATMFGELSNLKFDTAGNVLRENEALNQRGEDFAQLERRKRKALSKRLELPFPKLIPEVVFNLTPFLISKGYYVTVVNNSLEELTELKIRYRDQQGNVEIQKIADVLKAGGATNGIDKPLIDPSKVGWTIKAVDIISVLYDGGAATFQASDFIKN